MRKIITLVALVFVCATVGRAQGDHEYAPLQEHQLNYKDWTLKSATLGTSVNLRERTRGKKLVLVVYFAPWCHNWHNEAPIVARLYDKYKAAGFEVIAVSEYATEADRRAFFKDKAVPYTVVVESDKRDARAKTAHYRYRQLTGDKRNWGSPYNIFLVPAAFNQSGDVLTDKAWVVGGELIEQEVERFIREQLGLQ